MQYTSSALCRATLRVLPRRIHLLVVLCFLALAILGQPPGAAAGWVVLPAVTYAPGAPRQHLRSDEQLATGPSPWCWSGAWRYVCCTWPLPLLRSMALGLLWLASGRVGPWPVFAWPWVVWTWQLVGVLCPCLARQPEWQGLRWAARGGERVLLLGYVGLALLRGMAGLCLSCPSGQSGLGTVGLVCASCLVEVRHEPEAGCYQAELSGHFTLAVADDDPFRLRLLILFLRLLEDPDERRGSRRTRTGRTPFVRQQYLGQVLGIPHPLISRWEHYWLLGDWRRLLSQRTPEVLTQELQQQIITTWAHWPLWGNEQVRRLLVEQGVPVTEQQVRQAAEESGWQIVRQVLRRLCVQRAEALRLRDEWLLGDLLGQIDLLLGKLEAGERLTAEERLDLVAWQRAADAAGLQAKPQGEAEPWLRRVEQVLLPSPAAEAEGTTARVCCPDCGSSHVGRKGRQPRLKQVIDEQGQVQEVALYRYRCLNPECPRESFSVYPPGVVPYSRQRLEVHVLALQMYAWGYSTCRRTGQALGVSSMTAYRWVSAFGYQLLPVAALFGVVKSSGLWGWMRSGYRYPRTANPPGSGASGCTSTWPWTPTPMTCCTSPSMRTTPTRAPRPFCWPCGPKGIIRGWWSPTCGGTMAL